MSSTSLAVLQNGSIPVFADVDRRTFNLAAESVRNAITDKTRAILSVALYGLAPDYDALLNICGRRIALVEDNAQACLNAFQDREPGVYGDFASLSFQASKHLAGGEGGLLLTQNRTWADKARRFSSLGYGGISARQAKIRRADIQDPNYARHLGFGFNYRMSELQAAVILAQLERARDLVAARVRAAALFRNAAGNCEWFRPQYVPEGYAHSYWAFSAVLDVAKPETDWYRFRDHYARNGGDGIYAAWRLSYQEPLFVRDVQRRPGVRQPYRPGLCPQAEYLQKRLLQFKTNYWELSEAEAQAAILKKTIAEFKPTR